MSNLTPEQIAEQKAAKEAETQRVKEEKAAKKKAEAEAKAAKKQEDADKKKADAEAKKAAKLAESEAKKQKRVDDANAKKAAAEAKKADRENNRMPEQNGVRRPKPDTLCGKAWAVADQLSANLGQPVPIANLLEATNAQGLNEGNVKAEYARWRKFHGVTGRVTLPKPAAPANTEAGSSENASAA